MKFIKATRSELRVGDTILTREGNLKTVSKYDLKGLNISTTLALFPRRERGAIVGYVRQK